MADQRLAPAKVNLYLHVAPPGADGYHPICSLVTFASVGDVVAIEPADRFGFKVVGPFAEALGEGDDNLVVRAREALSDEDRAARAPFVLTLDKRLPIAAGLGGGSADAAAALHLMAGREGREPGRLVGVAAGLGADVPMCLAGRPCIAEGRGDRLSDPPDFPDLEAVLVNPLAPSPTGAVYRAYDAAGAPGDAQRPPTPGELPTPAAMARFLAVCRNDLEAPAIALQPAIAEVLSALRAAPEAVFARMSGSGATCFAICRDRAARDRLADRLRAGHPGWWTAPCVLAGSRGRSA